MFFHGIFNTICVFGKDFGDSCRRYVARKYVGNSWTMMLYGDGGFTLEVKPRSLKKKPSGFESKTLEVATFNLQPRGKYESTISTRYPPFVGKMLENVDDYGESKPTHIDIRRSWPFVPAAWIGPDAVGTHVSLHHHRYRAKHATRRVWSLAQKYVPFDGRSGGMVDEDVRLMFWWGLGKSVNILMASMKQLYAMANRKGSRVCWRRHAICWCTQMQTMPLALGYFFLKHLILFHLSQLIDVCLLPLPLDMLDCGICMDIYKPRLVSPLPIQPHIRTYQRPGSFAFSDLPKATARGGKIADVHPLLWQVPASFQRPPWKKLIESHNNMIFDVQWPRTYISRVCFIYSHGKVISHFFSYYRFHNVHHYLQYCRSYLVDRYYMVLEDVCWASFLELWNLMESLNDVDSSTTLSTPRVAHEV